MRARRPLAWDLLERAGENASPVLGVMLSIVGFDAEIRTVVDSDRDGYAVEHAVVRCLGCNAETAVDGAELRKGLFSGGFTMAHRCPKKVA